MVFTCIYESYLESIKYSIEVKGWDTQFGANSGNKTLTSSNPLPGCVVCRKVYIGGKQGVQRSHLVRERDISCKCKQVSI